MVWNTALNVTQVNTAMNIGFLGNEAGLVAYYKFNHGVANASNTGVTTLTDLAGGDNNGTLTNFTLSAGTVSNWVGGIALAPEINLQGNATTIADGDITPSTADHTDFGATLASTPIVRTFTIQNQGLRTLNITSISNTNTADFTVGTAPTSVAIGGSATFTITLNSATLGTKNATITINNDDPNESVYDFAITGRVINA
ncbi:MAG: choice-of-anchor D domain-containing protein, partial [Cytophagales bacterium]